MTAMVIQQSKREQMFLVSVKKNGVYSPKKKDNLPQELYLPMFASKLLKIRYLMNLTDPIDIIGAWGPLIYQINY